MTEKLGRSEPQPPLEDRLGYRFRNQALLKTALTPPSSGLSPNNQRLEFLGDAILQGCISRIIYEGHPEWDEGAMSKLRGLLVCTESLREWAMDLNLTLERGPRSLKHSSATHAGKPLADALEALLAAVYLDAEQSGQEPMKPVMAMVKARFASAVQTAHAGLWEAKDSKTTLQERASAAGLPAPIYELIERSGPDHEPRFRVRVRVGSQESTGSAGTLKRAQTEAARNLLGRMT